MDSIQDIRNRDASPGLFQKDIMKAEGVTINAELLGFVWILNYTGVSPTEIF